LGNGGFQDRLLQVKRSQLGPALGVNQQTVDQLLAIESRYKPMRRQLIMGIRSDVQRLQQLMSQGGPPAEREIVAVLGDLKRKRLEIHNLQQRQDGEETAILTPMQQARYLMYHMSLIKEARSIKGGPGGPGGRPAPGVMMGSPGPAGPGGMGVPTLRPSQEFSPSPPAQ